MPKDEGSGGRNGGGGSSSGGGGGSSGGKGGNATSNRANGSSVSGGSSKGSSSSNGISQGFEGTTVSLKDETKGSPDTLGGTTKTSASQGTPSILQDPLAAIINTNQIDPTLKGMIMGTLSTVGMSAIMGGPLSAVGLIGGIVTGGIRGAMKDPNAVGGGAVSNNGNPGDSKNATIPNVNNVNKTKLEYAQSTQPGQITEPASTTPAPIPQISTNTLQNLSNARANQINKARRATVMSSAARQSMSRSLLGA